PPDPAHRFEAAEVVVMPIERIVEGHELRVNDPSIRSPLEEPPAEEDFACPFDRLDQGDGFVVPRVSGGSEARLSDACRECRRRGLNRGSGFRSNVARHGSHEAEAQGESPDAKGYDPDGADEEGHEERAEHRARAPERILHEGVEREENWEIGRA